MSTVSSQVVAVNLGDKRGAVEPCCRRALPRIHHLLTERRWTAQCGQLYRRDGIEVIQEDACVSRVRANL